MAAPRLLVWGVGQKSPPRGVQAPPAYKEAGDWKPAQPNDQSLGGTWWAIFQEPQRDALELQVKGSNQNRKAPEARVRQARARLRHYRPHYYLPVPYVPSATQE